MKGNMGFSDMMIGAMQQGNAFAIFDVVKEKAKEHKHLMHIASKIEKAVATMEVPAITNNMYVFMLLVTAKDMLDTSPKVKEVTVGVLKTHPSFIGVDLDVQNFNPLDYGIVLLPTDTDVKTALHDMGKKVPYAADMISELTQSLNTSDVINPLMVVTMPDGLGTRYTISQVIF
jgi:hypothetical protein